MIEPHPEFPIRNPALARFDPEIAAAISGETTRQSRTLTLIASENHTYPEVLETNASRLTDKYAEGYPGRRYYAGQKYYDEIETIAVERAKVCFRTEHANVQPLSGSPMNQAVYFGLLSPGDTILAMELSHGGHLTHGAPASHMGKIFRFARYRTHGPRGDIDFDEVRRLAHQYKPKMILCGHSSYPRDLDYSAFKRIADDVGAVTMADISHIGGLVAAGVLKNPLDYGFDILTTTTHKTLRGPRGGLVACSKKLAKKIDASVFPGLQGGPHMHQIAGVAVALKKAASAEFRAYARQVILNARTLGEALASRNIPLVTGGTENHLLVMIVAEAFAMNGAEAQTRLETAGLITNKQVVPDDPRPPARPSGIRLGTPAATTRGMKEPEMRKVADFIARSLAGEDPDTIKDEVEALTTKFPIPGVD